MGCVSQLIIIVINYLRESSYKERSFVLSHSIGESTASAVAMGL